jgi:hypothetical protein
LEVIQQTANVILSALEPPMEANVSDLNDTEMPHGALEDEVAA